MSFFRPGTSPSTPWRRNFLLTTHLSSFEELDRGFGGEKLLRQLPEMAFRLRELNHLGGR